MSIRVTPSKDGLPRASINVRFRADSSIFVNAALWCAISGVGALDVDQVVKNLLKLTKAEIIEAARNDLIQNGYSESANPLDGFDEDERRELEDEAAARIDRLWPAFRRLDARTS